MQQIFTVQMRLPNESEVLLNQECLNVESLQGGGSMFSLNGFVFLEKFTICLSLLSYRRLTFIKPSSVSLISFVRLTIYSPTNPSSYGWNIFIRHKTQGNQSTNHSPVHTSKTVLQLPYDTPDSPWYLHVSNSTYFITLRLLVRLSSTYLCFLFFPFFQCAPLLDSYKTYYIGWLLLYDQCSSLDERQTCSATCKIVCCLIYNFRTMIGSQEYGTSWVLIHKPKKDSGQMTGLCATFD